MNGEELELRKGKNKLGPILIVHIAAQDFEVIFLLLSAESIR